MTEQSNESAKSWLWGRWSTLGLSVAAATCAIDQAHKLWMLLIYRIQDKGRVAFAPFLDLVYVKNVGISYGMMPGWVGPWALTTFALAASLALYIWLVRGPTTRLVAWSLGLIIGGAVGNAIDRMWLGGVADFFSLHAFGFYWYVFNIADVAIVAGVAGLLYDSVRGS
jgi:signal peptidase II